MSAVHSDSDSSIDKHHHMCAAIPTMITIGVAAMVAMTAAALGSMLLTPVPTANSSSTANPTLTLMTQIVSGTKNTKGITPNGLQQDGGKIQTQAQVPH
jgi:hypothetical protein